MTVLNRMDTLADELAARIISTPTGFAGVEGDAQWAAEIRRLARLRGATVLAHNYQLPAIQDVADHVGDSLALSRIAAEAPEDTIVFCGVHFMAETAKILSPDKTVLIPDQRAGCSLADSITPDDLRAWKAEHPGAVVVSYVNTTAEVKALTDICCTSSNAVDVVASIDPDREVLFCPDQFLGAHVRRVTGRKNLHVWAGECHVHAGINGDELAERGPREPRCRTVRAPRMWLRHFGFVSGRGGCLPGRAGQDPVHRRHAGGRAPDPRQQGAGRHRGRHAAPVTQGGTASRLPSRQRPRLVQVHEDDHPGGPVALPGGRRRRSPRGSGRRGGRPAQRAADDRDRPARRWRMTTRPVWRDNADVVVIGMGVAGLAAALAAHRAGSRVVVLNKAAQTRGVTATHYAQGGIAVVLPDNDDSIDAHVSDTLTAGAGLCDPDAVYSIVADGYRAVTELVSDGARFDEALPGTWDVTREGGHSRRRVVHAGGDATGAEVQRTLDHAARTLDIRSSHVALQVLQDDAGVTGVLVARPDGTGIISAPSVILATGGLGHLYSATTNPNGSTGDGIALALWAGLAVGDLEFIQFHPTMLFVPGARRPAPADHRGHPRRGRDLA